MLSAKAMYLNVVQLGSEPLDEIGWACTLRLCDIEADAVSSSSLQYFKNLEASVGAILARISVHTYPH